MIEKIITITVILICAMRVIGYGIYTAKDKNIAGSVSLFVLASIVLFSSVYFFIM